MKLWLYRPNFVTVSLGFLERQKKSHTGYRHEILTGVERGTVHNHVRNENVSDRSCICSQFEINFEIMKAGSWRKHIESVGEQRYTKVHILR
jgi:hypothetical protein